MVSHAPIEIWEKILKYAISVPLFFESDPTAMYGVEKLGDCILEASYWQSERTRNRLRRTCHSWDHFLRGYDHRYVRLSDVLHHRIPSAAIPMAIRLNIERERSCTCSMYCGISGSTNAATVIKRTRRLMMELLLITINNDPTPVWNLKIFHWAFKHDLVTDELHIGLFTPLKGRVPGIESFIGYNMRELEDMIEGAEQMRNLYTRDTWLNNNGVPWPSTLRPANLTTLLLARMPANLDTADWYLPSLRHLSIQAPPYDRAFRRGAGPALMRFLEKVGKNLLTFYYGGYSTFDVPMELWTYAPVLERIQMAYWPLNSPPAFHPVRYVRLSTRRLRQSGDIWGASSVLKFLPGWASQAEDHVEAPQGDIKRGLIIQMDRPWHYELFWADSERAIYIAGLYRERGVKFTDSDGVTLHDYIVFLIKSYWKEGRAKRAPRYTIKNWVHTLIF